MLLVKVKSVLIGKGSLVRAEFRVALGPGKETMTGRVSGLWRPTFRRALVQGE